MLLGRGDDDVERGGDGKEVAREALKLRFRRAIRLPLSSEDAGAESLSLSTDGSTVSAFF